MNLILILPELITLLIFIRLLVWTLAPKAPKSKAVGDVMTWGAFVLVAVSLFCVPSAALLFSGSYRIDLLSQGFKVILAVSFLISVILSKNSHELCEKKIIEYYLFMTSATLGMLMIPSAVDLATLYVSLELSSYSLYVLSALKLKRQSAEASAKYIIFGAAASGVMLWGFSLISGLAGSTSLAVISQQAVALSSQSVFIVAVLMVSAAFLFKLSAFPFHFWAPDIYETSHTPVTAFIATASKAAAVAVLIRVLIAVGLTTEIITILGWLAFVSMTVGNCVALAQTDVKRLLAYSSIAQAGYILVGLISGTIQGFAACFFYAFSYVLMNSGAFLVTGYIAKAIKKDNPSIKDFDGLADKSPFLALLLLLSLLSLAGIPPLVGFTGKWIMFTSSMEQGHWFLVLWAVLNSVVSLFYYLSLVKHSYLGKASATFDGVLSLDMKILGFILMSSLVLLGFFPNFIIIFTQQAVMQATQLF